MISPMLMVKKVSTCARAVHGARILLCGMLTVAALSLAASPARAICVDCSTISSQHQQTRAHITYEHDRTRLHISEEFYLHKLWIEDIVVNWLIPAWSNMTADFIAGITQQGAIAGGFFDAQQQMKAQRAMEELEAQVYRDYKPDMALCTMGTNVKGLAAAQQRGELSAATLKQWSQARMMGTQGSSAAGGEHVDRAARQEQMVSTYCNTAENNKGLGYVCKNGAGDPARLGRDIDYAASMDNNLTLNMDFTNPDAESHREDIFALASNLYGHRVPFRIPEGLLQTPGNREKLLDMRSVVAKRSVAEASFFAIAGMKSSGDPDTGADTAQYMNAVLKAAGVNPEESPMMLGENPSYYAQMEVLTKKMYQNPRFFADLYTDSANLQRQRVSMQAIGLMQNYDLLESFLRTEMMLSVLLEIEIGKLQGDVQRRIDTVGSGGRDVNRI